MNNEKTKKTRSYKSPLRERLTEETKKAILDGVALVILDTGLDSLSMQKVAERAQVSERTLYRHFQTKEYLLDEFWDRFNHQTGLVELPTNYEQLHEYIKKRYMACDKNEQFMKAYLFSQTYRTQRNATAPLRKNTIAKSIKEFTEGMNNKNKKRLSASVYIFYDLFSWVTMNEIWEMKTEESVETAKWAIATLLEAASK